MQYTMSEGRKAYVEQSYEKIRAKLDWERAHMGMRIPNVSVNGVYPDMGKASINWWTNGFWAGIMWQMFHATEEENYRIEAMRVEKQLEAAFRNYDVLDHDIGFMWLHTSVARYRLTGDTDARLMGLRAAGALAARFCPKGQYIRAWNPPKQSGMIIDCLMNLPLLYWAQQEAGIERYGDIAKAHLQTALTYLIREDGSCNHIAEFSEETGELTALPGGQGYEAGSSWSRGQAWAIYGMALAYGYTKDVTMLNAAKKVAHYFIANVALTDYVSLVDFRAPEEPVYYDASAAACAACGMLELAKYVGEYEKRLYIESAYRIYQSLTTSFCEFDLDNEGILQKCTAKYHRAEDREVPIIYGDYFLTELALRFSNKDFLIW